MKAGEKLTLRDPHKFHRSANEVFTVIAVKQCDEFGSGVGVQLEPTVWVDDFRGTNVFYDMAHFIPVTASKEGVK